jgi:flagellar biosynthesis chaperone FliJ
MNEEIELLRGEKAALRHGIADVQTENGILSRENEDNRQETSALQNQVKNMNEVAAQRDASIVMLNNENRQLKKQIEDLEVEIKSAAEKLKTFKKRVEALKEGVQQRGKIVKTDDEDQQLKKQIEDLEVEAKSAVKKLETFKKRVEALKDDF